MLYSCLSDAVPASQQQGSKLYSWPWVDEVLGEEQIIRHFPRADPWLAYSIGKSPLLVMFPDGVDGKECVTRTYGMETDNLLAFACKFSRAARDVWYDHSLPWGVRKNIALEAYQRDRPEGMPRGWREAELRMQFQILFKIVCVRQVDLDNHIEHRRTIGHSGPMLDFAIRFWKSNQSGV